MSATPSESAERFVSAPIIAAKYGVTSRYVLQLAAAGRIPSLRIGRKCVRFDEAAVAKALGLHSKNFDTTPTDGEGLPGGTP